MENTIDILAAWREYQALPDNEWRKDYFNEATGGFVATHIHKERDDLRRPGIAAEVRACFELAKMGKHVLRLPENIPDLIDEIAIAGIPYRKMLKFKPGETNPRGYPDAYFDGQTWDFKASISENEDTLRQLIKDGRKADNVIFISTEKTINNCLAIQSAIGREYGRRLKTALGERCLMCIASRQISCMSFGKNKKGGEFSVFSWGSKNPFGLELRCKDTTFFSSRKGF